MAYAAAQEPEREEVTSCISNDVIMGGFRRMIGRFGLPHLEAGERARDVHKGLTRQSTAAPFPLAGSPQRPDS